MERPKHRWFIGPGALLAGAVIVLLGRQYVPSSGESVPLAANAPSPRPAEEQADLPTVEPAAPNRPAAAVAATGGDLRGRIIDAVTRLPIREFEVRLTRVEANPSLREDPITRTFQSDTGRFQWRDVAPDSWQIVVATPGYQQFDGGKVTIAAGKATPEIIMPLRRGYTVSGRVVEQGTGAGIVGADVAFSGSNARHRYKQQPDAKSQEDGSFVLEGVPGGEVVLTVSEQAHATRSVDIEVDEKTPPQEIALSSGGTIAGTVQTIAGVPVMGSVTLYGNRLTGAVTLATNETGRFAFDHLPAGAHQLAAQTAAGGTSQEVVLGLDERKVGIVLVVGGGRSVRGTVKGVRPERRKEVSLMLQSDASNSRGTVDARGAYVINGVQPGRAMLSASDGGRQIYQAISVPQEQDLVLDLVFPAGVRLSGRVTQGGQPAQNRYVWLQPADESSWTQYRAWTDADGQYEIEGVPPGDYRITAQGDVTRSVTIAADTVRNIALPSVQLAGRVLENSGAPIVGASVFVRGDAESTMAGMSDRETDDFGAFSATGVEPGDIQLTVYKPGYELYREKLTYSTPVKNKSITLRSDRGVEVKVHVTPRGGGERMRSFMVAERSPDFGTPIMVRIPVGRDGIAFLPSGLTGSTLIIFGSGIDREPTVISAWDGSSFELTF